MNIKFGDLENDGIEIQSNETNPETYNCIGENENSGCIGECVGHIENANGDCDENAKNFYSKMNLYNCLLAKSENYAVEGNMVQAIDTCLIFLGVIESIEKQEFDKHKLSQILFTRFQVLEQIFMWCNRMRMYNWALNSLEQMEVFTKHMPEQQLKVDEFKESIKNNMLDKQSAKSVSNKHLFISRTLNEQKSLVNFDNKWVEMKHTQYGRGLVAKQKIKKGQAIIVEKAIIYTDFSSNVCHMCHKSKPETIAQHENSNPKKNWFSCNCGFGNNIFCSGGCRQKFLETFGNTCCMCQHFSAVKSYSPELFFELHNPNAKLILDKCLESDVYLPTEIANKVDEIIDSPLETLDFNIEKVMMEWGLFRKQYIPQDKWHIYDMVWYMNILVLIKRNAFGSNKGHRLMDKISFVNHSCYPNCQVTAIKDNATLRATKTIGAGEEILFDYMHGMKQKRKMLASYGISCHCPDCRLEKIKK